MRPAKSGCRSSALFSKKYRSIERFSVLREAPGDEQDLGRLVDQGSLVDMVEAVLPHVAEVGDADGEADAGRGHGASARPVRGGVAGNRGTCAAVPAARS